jgi:hypothetical protein
MKKTDDNLGIFIKRMFPQAIENWPQTPCPDENTLAAFLDGQLRGKSLNDLYSHFLVCKKGCKRTVIALRKSMAIPKDELDYETSERLRKIAKEVFPPEPKEWEIGLKKIGKRFEPITYTGELGLTFPELQPLSISTGRRFTHEERHKILQSIETVSPQLSNIVKKVDQMTSDLTRIDDEIQRLKGIGDIERQKEKSLLKKGTDLSKLLSDIKMKEPSGFFFQDHLGKYETDLFLMKPQIDSSDFIEIQVGVCGSNGKPPEAMELALLQGQKTIEKAMAGSGITISKKMEPNKFRIRFRQYGIYMGQVVVNFKK